MLRRPRRAALGVARHLDGEDVVVAEPRQRRDVEAVREEVALGIAEVGAVEPHVGLVEDAVERDPAALARRRRRQVEAAAVQDRAVAVGECGVRRASARGRVTVGQSPSSTSRPMPSRRRSSSAALARHAPTDPRRRRLARGAVRASGRSRCHGTGIEVYPRRWWCTAMSDVEPTINGVGGEGFAVDGTDSFAIDAGRPVDEPAGPPPGSRRGLYTRPWPRGWRWCCRGHRRERRRRRSSRACAAVTCRRPTPARSTTTRPTATERTDRTTTRSRRPVSGDDVEPVGSEVEVED